MGAEVPMNGKHPVWPRSPPRVFPRSGDGSYWVSFLRPPMTMCSLHAVVCFYLLHRPSLRFVARASLERLNEIKVGFKRLRWPYHATARRCVQDATRERFEHNY